ncbi:hypothetical protein GLV98_10700 [Halobacillus litoralis]|uniref:Phosphoribulokinase/uridine kinase domain-containing protein n=1 Tax=Halobacillus litoralis TaxID=45668 RepID=A0A845EFG2_9BACI|nr:hypothetical protein [Halobacillus litoralis]MYL49958.1 hypothetical protein [Halobacillus litoralis]
MTKPMVIAVAAVSVGGKTTITKKLKDRLAGAQALFFDSYDFEGAPENITEWVEDGPDYHQWELDPLMEDIQSAQHAPFLILDYPFSYKHERMKPWIDYSVFIDTPLDIAMARRLIRDEDKQGVEEELNHYLNGGRKAYLEMLHSIKPDADLIVDGTLGVEDIVEHIIKNLPSEHH